MSRYIFISGLALTFFLVPNAYASATSTTILIPATHTSDVESLSPVGTWEDVRNTNSGRLRTDPFEVVSAQAFSSNRFNFSRPFFSFDTSVLPDNVVIEAASLQLYVEDVLDQVNDPDYSYIAILEGFQANSLDVTPEDYDVCGSLDNPLLGSIKFDTSNIFENQYVVFSLNATGSNWIDPKDFTQLCMRSGHDIENQEFSSNGSWRHDGFVFVREGSSTGPLLEITYALDGEEEKEDVAGKFEELRSQIEGFELPNRVEKIFLKNLEKAEEKITDGKKQAAIKKLHGFIWMVKLGKAMGIFSKEERSDLIDCSRELIDLVKEFELNT